MCVPNLTWTNKRYKDIWKDFLRCHNDECVWFYDFLSSWTRSQWAHVKAVGRNESEPSPSLAATNPTPSLCPAPSRSPTPSLHPTAAASPSSAPPPTRPVLPPTTRPATPPCASKRGERVTHDIERRARAATQARDKHHMTMKNYKAAYASIWPREVKNCKANKVDAARKEWRRAQHGTVLRCKITTVLRSKSREQ